MKKMLIALAVFVLVACSSDSNGDATPAIESSFVVDGVAFKPNRAVYRYNPWQTTDLHKTVTLTLSKNSQPVQVLNLTLYLPFSKENLEGVYSFGPGEADELLAEAGYANADKSYSIVGTTVTVTELGTSKFQLTFQNPLALDVAVGFAERPVSGEIEASFALEEN